MYRFFLQTERQLLHMKSANGVDGFNLANFTICIESTFLWCLSIVT